MYLILSFCVRSSRWYNIAKMNCDDYRWHNIVDGTFADKLQTSTPVEHPTFEVDIVEVIVWSLKLHAASFFDSKPSRAESRIYGKIWPWDESLDRRRFYMERFSRTSFHFLLVVLFSRQPSQPSRQARQPMHNTSFRLKGFIVPLNRSAVWLAFCILIHFDFSVRLHLPQEVISVSYTHLTLPTILLV